MNPAPRGSDGHDETARLLPWFVNGTLEAADARAVEAHLEGCACCRDDAIALEQVRTLLRSPDAVEHAPHSGLRKLMQRIDAQSALPGPDAGERAAMPPGLPASRPRFGSPLRWLAAAVVLQSVALVVVGTAALRGQDREDAAYRTLTSAPAPVHGAALRVVFASSMTLGELQALLQAHRLAVRAGPSAAGLFTLATPDAQAGEAEAVLARLRADPRVRFAEPLGPEASKP